MPVGAIFREKRTKRTINRSIPLDEAHRKLGRRIRSLRAQKHLTQSQLAHLSHVWPGYIGKIERAEHDITVLNLVQIAKHLDLAVAALLRGIM